MVTAKMSKIIPILVLLVVGFMLFATQVPLPLAITIDGGGSGGSGGGGSGGGGYSPILIASASDTRYLKTDISGNTINYRVDSNWYVYDYDYDGSRYDYVKAVYTFYNDEDQNIGLTFRAWAPFKVLSWEPELEYDDTIFDSHTYHVDKTFTCSSNSESRDYHGPDLSISDSCKLLFGFAFGYSAVDRSIVISFVLSPGESFQITIKWKSDGDVNYINTLGIEQVGYTVDDLVGSDSRSATTQHYYQWFDDINP